MIKIIEELPKCPICGKEMTVERLHCDTCNITIEGEFKANPFVYLSKEKVSFLLTFLKARGNIKEVERILGISYPTVRSRLDLLLNVLGITPIAIEEEEEKEDVLEMLNKGEITSQEAIKILKERRK